MYVRAPSRVYSKAGAGCFYLKVAQEAACEVGAVKKTAHLKSVALMCFEQYYNSTPVQSDLGLYDTIYHPIPRPLESFFPLSSSGDIHVQI